MSVFTTSRAGTGHDAHLTADIIASGHLMLVYFQSARIVAIHAGEEILAAHYRRRRRTARSLDGKMISASVTFGQLRKSRRLRPEEMPLFDDTLRPYNEIAGDMPVSIPHARR